MPLKAKELKPLQIKNLGTGTHRVGGCIGLCLTVVTDTNKHWTLRFRLHGKDQEMGLGSFPSVTLEMARANGRQIREQISNGLNPIDERNRQFEILAASQRSKLTFKEAFYEYFPHKRANLKNAKHAAQWESTLKQYVFPIFGERNIDTLEMNDVIDCLLHEAFWSKKPETASRVRQRIKAVFQWAISKNLYKGINPALWQGLLEFHLPDPVKLKEQANGGVAKQEPMVPLNRAAEFFAELSKRQGMAADILRLITLTACRSGQARFAKWYEFDLDDGIWHIKKGRKEAKLRKRDHHVALTSSALKLLKSLPKDDEEDWVFPSTTNRPLSSTAVSNVMRTIHKNAKRPFICPDQRRPAVPHGLRATVTTWWARNGIEGDLLKFQLSHDLSDTVYRHYLREDLVERRRAKLQLWDDYLTGVDHEQ